MKIKTFLTTTLILFHISVFAQFTAKDMRVLLASSVTVEKVREIYPNACYLYNSAEDYYKNNPIPDAFWNPWNFQGQGTKIEVSRNGKLEMVKISEMGDTWFSDESGFLMRRNGKYLYKVVVDGPICYYVEYTNGEVYREPDGTYEFMASIYSTKFIDYYSLTLKGEMDYWSEKMFEAKLKEHNLLEAYHADKPKREAKDSVGDFESKKKNKRIKYLKMLNEKMAVK
jgi:hypothetical protein